MLRTITKDELKIILDNHTLWLNNKGGSKADLSSADLRSADLLSTDLSYANLRSANLSYANLRSANLSYANLRYANLRSADLRYADLSSANLSFANLRYANLLYADLRSADLLSTDLSSANLSSADLDKKYVQISCIGSRKGITTYCIDDDFIWCACWTGNIKDFEKRVRETHKENKQYLKEYLGAIKYFKSLK